MRSRAGRYWLVPAALCGLLTTAPVCAQQTLLPNTDGSNSTFAAAAHSKAASDASSGTVSAVPVDFPDLRLSPGVLLSVAVYGEPDLGTQARVNQKGDIVLPLIGAIHVAGKTVTEAQAAVETKYQSAQILKYPQVMMNVLQYVNSGVVVLGEVQSPGRYTMLGSHSLLDVLGLAGGETNLAGDVIQVEGPAKDGSSLRTYHYLRGEDESALRNALIDPGETVRVNRAGVIYVLGAVYRPGGYVMQENGSLNVAQAVSLAQGTLMQAKIGGMRVIRRQPDGTYKDLPVDYKQVMKGKHPPLELEAQDIVYVPVSKIKSVFTAGANIVGETSSAAIYTVR
ncbi:MAG: polysaccharide biosynthesis/export family protein [Acidobacteriaceae bacterium]